MTDAESLDSLRENLEHAKEQLKSVDNDIKRVTGRDPAEDRFNRFTRRPPDSVNRAGIQIVEVISGYKRKSDDAVTLQAPTKRPFTQDPVVLYSRVDSNYADLDEVVTNPPEEELKVSLASSVIRVTETRSRSDVSRKLQSSDKERGRRMLGVLQGTLNQFRAESVAAGSKPQTERRRQVDAKLEARAKEEKESLRRERTDLFRARRKQQLEVSLIQQKMRMLHAFESWKAETEKMIGFCRSERKPGIYYRPRVENEESKRRTEATAEIIKDIIERRRCRMEADFEAASKIRRRNMTLAMSRYESKDIKEPKDGDEVDLDSKPDFGAIRNGSLSSVVSPVGKSVKDSLTAEAFLRATAHLDDGNLSDGSEAFGLEGDEPLLMDEELHRQHHPSSPNSSVVAAAFASSKASPSTASHKSPALSDAMSTRRSLREDLPSDVEVDREQADTPFTDTRTVRLPENVSNDDTALAAGFTPEQ